MGSRGWFVLEESVDPLREHVLNVYGRKRVLVRGVILYIYIYKPKGWAYDGGG